MLTQTTQYALQALAYIAAEPEDWHDVRQVSRAVDIPANYLSKILGQLAKLGILESRKGWGGGFRVARAPRDIRLGEVIRPLEGAGRPRPCVFGLAHCSDEDPCPLHDYWKRVSALHEKMLDRSTVADLVQNPKVKKMLGKSR